ncbi:MAG: cytochrome P450 [Actinomycetota bacterium]
MSTTTLRPPPGPPGTLQPANIVAMRRDELGFYRGMAERYGDIVRFRMGPLRMCLVTDPQGVEQVLVTRNHDIHKSPFYEAMKRVLGEGLLTSEDEFHKRQRRLIQPIFHHRRIKEYGEAMVDYGVRYRDRWQDGQVLDLHQEMMGLTLAIVGKTLFGADVERDAADVGEAMATLLGMLDRLLLFVVFMIGGPLADNIERLPVPAMRQFRAARDGLDRVIGRMIEEKRAEGADGSDLLSRLLVAEEDGAGMTDQQLRDEAITIFLAGHETTAVALSWTFYLLSRHQDVEGKLHAELDEVLGDRVPTVEDLSRLDYTRKVLSEAMRLFPPAWMIGRQAIADLELCGYDVPKGTILLTPPFLVHRDPRWWPEPRRFDPERFSQEEEAKRPRYAYFPFGGGPRLCIGESFAWMEGELLLATIAQRWRPRLLPGQPAGLQPQVTLRPKGGMRVTMHAR